MRQLCEKVGLKNLSNAWGRPDNSQRQAFAVEQGDVGQTRENYMGHNHGRYTFKPDDVGRVVEYITMPGYMCWCFGSCIPAFQGIKRVENPPCT